MQCMGLCFESWKLIYKQVKVGRWSMHHACEVARYSQKSQPMTGLHEHVYFFFLNLVYLIFGPGEGRITQGKTAKSFRAYLLQTTTVHSLATGAMHVNNSILAHTYTLICFHPIMRSFPLLLASGLIFYGSFKWQHSSQLGFFSILKTRTRDRP